jgi:hypothetical protein
MNKILVLAILAPVRLFPLSLFLRFRLREVWFDQWGFDVI